MSQPLFDVTFKSQHFARAIKRAQNTGEGHALYLHHQIAEEVADRIQMFSQSFDNVTVLRDLGLDWRALLAPKASGARIQVQAGALDVESLGLEPASQDLIIAPLCLHWVEDLPQMLLALRLALKPGGLLIGALFGGESLIELKRCLAEAEDLLCGGMHPRTSPAVDLRSLASLVQGGGFALPVTDVDRLPLRYASALKLMKDLSDAGEGNALSARARRPLRRDVMMQACALYHQRYGDDQGLVPVTCDVLHFSASASASASAEGVAGSSSLR